jgi:hypothetical protein
MLVIFAMGQVRAGERHAEFHHWYKGLKSNYGGSCGNGKDCGSTRFRVQEGKVQVIIHGRWCDVDEKSVLKGKIAPDMGSHVCAPEKPLKGAECLQYCVIIGTGV